MEVKRLFLAALIVLSAPFARAQAPAATLEDASYLRKLSLHVRGTPPAPTEYGDLRKAQANKTTQAFFDAKIQEYFATTGYQTKMTYRLQELFKLRTAVRAVGVKPVSDFQQPEYRDALSNLFIDIASKNLSWDELLTAKSYRLFPIGKNTFPAGVTDFAFLSPLFPKQIPQPPNDVTSADKPVAPVDIVADPTDVRVAGALTTSRFFNRYTTTELNKNRRRAAAVFNIFLCDPMAAAIPDPPASPDDDLDRAFPDTTTVTEDDIAKLVAVGDKHGSDVACAKCHYKLDPVGQTFMTSTVSLSPLASPGRLTYRDQKTNVLIDVPVNGLGELGQAITKQDQYLRCQVDRFWTWFIGEDRELTETRERELINEFNRVGRRTNDFVSVLLHAPEFRTRDFRTEFEIRADAVRGVLKNCVACHDAKIPDFTAWPIGGDAAAMKTWAGRISTRLDLAHDGAGRDMPPTWSVWQPSAKETALLKAWLDDGAPDEKGDRQL